MERTYYRIPVAEKVTRRQVFRLTSMFSLLYISLGFLTVFLCHDQPDPKADEAIPIFFLSWPFATLGMYFYGKYKFKKDGIEIFKNGVLTVHFFNKFEFIEPCQKHHKLPYCSSDGSLWNLHDPTSSKIKFKVPIEAFPNLDEQLSTFSKG